MIPTAQRTSATIAIMRFGSDATIIEPTGTATDAYGKVEEVSWEAVGTETVVRIYQRGSTPEQIEVTGGRYLSDSPVLLFRYDTAVDDGFRVELLGSLYEIETTVRYPTHVEGEARVVN